MTDGMRSAGIDVADRLAEWLSAVLDEDVAVRGAVPLEGGAIQENWRIDADVGREPRRFVLRTDAAATIGASHDRATEFDIVRAVHAAGVTVPEPIGFCADPSVVGRPFGLFAFVEGAAFGPRLVRDPALEAVRPRLAEDLGRELAKIHAIRPDAPGLSVLGDPPVHPALSEVTDLRATLDRLGIVRPVLEWGLRWAEVTAPEPSLIVLTHRDFRTGNYLVGPGGLAAVLDWEFADWGDPMADLGWFCAECWRFGRPDLEAGGIGTREAFYRGYEAVSGRPVDDPAVRHYEIVAHLRWAVIALEQGRRHLSGVQPSLELALTSRIVPELELRVMRATGPERWLPGGVRAA